ncbi:MAG: hypothetical protein HZB37_07545 [Planctomycetes bacterium]|nr:hypothetical protein [Planctomycetota bacterium]
MPKNIPSLKPKELIHLLRQRENGIREKLGFAFRLCHMNNFTLFFIFLPHFKGKNVTKHDEIRLKWAIFKDSSPLLE